MNIGDIFFSGRIDNSQLVPDATKGGTAAGTAGGKAVGGAMSAAFKTSFSAANLGQGIVQGLGLAGGLGIASIVSKFVDVVGDAITAAREDEVSIQKLGTSLKANVKDWDGNTAAIERTIASRIRLGYSDEEQRNSLALLVGATHDVTKALDIERVAMDLVAYKKAQGEVLSLTDASEALTKVEAGSYRILKGLGIQLEKGATQTQALAAVEAVAAGQAEDLANTNEGKLRASQVRLGEAMEKLGYVVMPAWTEAMITAQTAASGFATAIDVITNGAAKDVDAKHEQTNALLDLIGAFGLFNPAAEAWAEDQKALQDAAWQSAHAMSGMQEQSGKMADDVIADSAAVAKASMGMASDIGDSTREINTSYKDLRDYMLGYASDLADGFFDPIKIKQDEYDAHVKISADVAALAGDKTKQAYKDAKKSIVGDLDDERGSLDKLAAKGKLTVGDVQQFQRDTTAAYKALGQKVPVELQHVIDKYMEIARLRPTTVKLSVDDLGSNRRGYNAFGGTMMPGQVSWVGETGRELWVPQTPGVVVPHNASEALVASGALGGGGGNTYNIQLPGPPTPDPFETMRQLRRLSDFGVLP